MDAGLPPHQFHIHPLPQHYQHYLTSPRMHHFPRNNASTQVVSPFLPLLNHSCASPSAPGDSSLGSEAHFNNRMFPLPVIIATELIPASFLCRLPGCPRDQKLPVPAAALAGSAESQSLSARLCRSRELRGFCYSFLSDLRLTGLHSSILISYLTDAQMPQ